MNGQKSRLFSTIYNALCIICLIPVVLKKKTKQVLNEMRPILFNEKDSVHYNKIILIAKQMIGGYHKPKPLLMLSILMVYILMKKYSGVRIIAKHIKKIILKSDLITFIIVCFNIVLWNIRKISRNYKNGMIENILIKNAIITSYIAELLASYLQPLLMFYVSATNH
jgi:hypothetical protein